MGCGLGGGPRDCIQGCWAQDWGEIGDFLDQINGVGRFAICVPVSVVIPGSARRDRIEFKVSDGVGEQNCVMRADGGCDIEWGRFDAPFYVQAGDSLIIILTEAVDTEVFFGRVNQLEDELQCFFRLIFRARLKCQFSAVPIFIKRFDTVITSE
jgi:hypothetical protein